MRTANTKDSSETSSAPKEGIVVSQSSNNSLVETILGGFVLVAFVTTWFSSLASPFILYYTIVTKNHVVLSIIIVLTTLAYTPWKRGSVIGLFRTAFVDRYHKLYYKKYSMTFQRPLPDPKEKEIFYAFHPHGMFCLGYSTLYHSDIMANVRFCFSTALFLSPFFQLWSRLTGKPGKADKKSMLSYMKNGESLALPPGGFEEATISSSSQDRVYIKKRKGFVKLCLMHGYSIVPCYCFGEKNTYNNVQGFWKLRLALNSWSIPAICFWGMKLLPILPKRCELHVFVGSDLKLPKIENPTRKDVELWHGKYVEALEKLFENNKLQVYGEVEGRNRHLELW